MIAMPTPRKPTSEYDSTLHSGPPTRFSRFSYSRSAVNREITTCTGAESTSVTAYAIEIRCSTDVNSGVVWPRATSRNVTSTAVVSSHGADVTATPVR